MKKTLAILAAASFVVAGCDRQGEKINESAGAAKDEIKQAADAQKEALNREKKEIKESAHLTKEEINEQAKAEKDRLESQVDAKEAQINAEKKQIEAQADASKAEAEARAKEAEAQTDTAKAEVDAQRVNEAAGAANTPGQGTTEADRTLNKRVQDSLMTQNAGLTGVTFTVTTTDGKVTLSGTVTSEAQKEALEAQAKAVSGVTSVDNKLEVKSE